MIVYYSTILTELGRELSDVQRQLGETPTGNVATSTPGAGAFGPQQTFAGNQAAAWDEPWVRKGQIGCVVVAGAAAAGAGALAYAGVNVVIWGTASATAAEATASYTAIMNAFFKGQTLLYSPTTVAALLWYRSIAQAVLDKYAAQGYTGPGIATQLARLQQIAEQLKAWGVE